MWLIGSGSPNKNVLALFILHPYIEYVCVVSFVVDLDICMFVHNLVHATVSASS